MTQSNRPELCFHQGSKYEQLFSHYLRSRDIPFQSEVGTDSDYRKKIDFWVAGSKINVKAPTTSGPPGLCVEWRAVDGSIGWLHQVDFVVKFTSENAYKRISCGELKAYVIETLGEPPAKCPQTGAGRSNNGWYARTTWQGRDRSKEACVIVPFDNIKHISKEIKL